MFQFIGYSQEDSLNAKPPVFPNCETVEIDSLQSCFDENVFNHIFNNFKVPQKVFDENYQGKIVVLFEVDVSGIFKVIYVDAIYNELEDEVKRVLNPFLK